MKNSNFKTFRWVNGVASFCGVNSPECLVVTNREKKYIKFVILYTNSFLSRQNEFGRTPESFSVSFFFAGISLVTATCSKRGS